jgi:hypothetical protein
MAALLIRAELSSAADPVAISLNPFPASRWWGGQREIENRDQPSMALTVADRHDRFGIIEIDAFDSDLLAKYVSRERTRQVLLQHAEKAHALFRIAVRIDNGFLDE